MVAMRGQVIKEKRRALTPPGSSLSPPGVRAKRLVKLGATVLLVVWAVGGGEPKGASGSPLEPDRVDMIIAGDGDGVYDTTFSGLGGEASMAAEKGIQVYFPVTLQNEGSLPDAFLLTWVKPTRDWDAFLVEDGTEYPFPFTTAIIPPDSEQSYLLKIVVPRRKTKPDIYRSILNAVSITDSVISESVSATLEVFKKIEIDVLIDGSGRKVYGPLGSGLGGSSTREVSPGDSVSFMVEIMNYVGPNQFDISWNTPPGWIVTLDGLPPPLVGYPAGVYELKVVVPLSYPGGSVDIIVDACKSDKPFFIDSVKGSVVVVPPLVDALIDGDGDEAFGTTGSGLGGSSTRFSLAPGTVGFTLEIQNQGLGADSYTIAWNQVPLWNATLDGSPSPYSTGLVSPGSPALFTFEVEVPSGEDPGSYSYIIDIFSAADSNNVESVEAIITVLEPSRADLVIDGNGSGVFGPVGSGAGGESHRMANPGSFYTADLLLANVGSAADSFLIWWEIPPEWPAGSVVISDGTSDYADSFTTPIIAPGAFLEYQVKVQVPSGSGTSSYPVLINAREYLPLGMGESVRLLTQTSAAVSGIVFDDRDHDGVYSPGDVGLAGVLVSDEISGSGSLTGGDGRFTILVSGGGSAYIIERNPSGYISLSPDSLGPFFLNAGDTLALSFADVPPVSLSPGTVLNGLAGAYIDFPHTVEVGTKGQVVISASGSGLVIMLLLDENGNGVFDPGERELLPGDGDLDPDLGKDGFAFLLRVFIPADASPGSTFRVDVEAVESISGTLLTSSAKTSDVALVVGSALGRLRLSKGVDKTSALPGEVITYTIGFFNAGPDSVQNVLLVDPISGWVDVVPDGFGSGQDVEWEQQGSGTTYLTFDPADGDECGYSSSERLLRIDFSKNTPFFVAPGDSGRVAYKVRVK